MYQVTFSEQSIAELNKISILEQLKVVDIISSITADQLKFPEEPICLFKKEKKTFYRVRAGEYRCYFEVRDKELYSHYILHKNTLADFVYRNNLPFKEEQAIEQDQSFWKYLESLAKR